MFEKKPAVRSGALVALGISLSLSCAPAAPGDTIAPAAQPGGDDPYRAELGGAGEARFQHAAQGFEATIDGAGLRLAPSSHGRWALSLSPGALGCEGRDALRPDRGTVEIAGDRVTIARGDLREWYVNGPRGLEQGFSLSRAPACAGIKVLALDVGGNTRPAITDGDRGQAAAFVAADGRTAAHYTGLAVTDATGRRLRAWMSASDHAISLHVDDAGAVYPVVIDPLIWVKQQKLGPQAGSTKVHFGHAVAIDGDTAIVGAPFDEVGGIPNRGSAYIFVRSAGVWTPEVKLTALESAGIATFGFSVAIEGDTALIGAPYETIGANEFQGAAYVFTRANGVWAEQQRITAAEGTTNDQLGSAVALSGDTAIAGSLYHEVGQGAAYVFTRTNGTWTEQQELTAPDGAHNDFFGASLALDGDTALVSAYNDDIDADVDRGSVYFFTRANGTWGKGERLTASDGKAGDRFGFSVALDGDTALIGASFDDVGGSAKQGSAYLFTRSGQVWTEGQHLTASDGTAGDQFGGSVALSGDAALVGASLVDLGGNEDLGAAYVFRLGNGAWTEEQRLIAGDGTFQDRFGMSVALSAGTALIGAPFADIGVDAQQGTAYVFVVPLANGATCDGDAACGSGHCADGVCCDTACGGGDPGDCQACSAAAGAATDGLCAPVAAGVTCRAAASECDVAESCDGQGVACPADQLAQDGAACPGGTCQGGTCEAGTTSTGATSSGTASTGAGGASASSSAGSGGDAPGSSGGCGCRVSSDTTRGGWALLAASLGMLLPSRRRARRARAATRG
ncbi:MAG: hypothetical protein U0359_02530 [Byssovorax sp.]